MATRGLSFCMLTTFYPPYNFGGDGIGVQRLARALVRRGHRVTVAHDTDAFSVLSGGRPPTPEATDDGVAVIRLASRFERLSTLLTQQTGRPTLHRGKLRRLLAGDRFDVVMFHNLSLVGGPGLLGFSDAVTLYEAHEHWLVCPTHVLWRHGAEPCPGRQCLRCSLHYRRPPQLWRYTGYLERQLRHVDAFVAKSAFSRAKHREFGFPFPMRVIPYFLPDEPPTTDPGSEGISPHPRPYALFVGRLERIKGLDDVIPVFARLDDVDLLIAGDGGHGGALRKIAAGAPGVRFLGRLGPDRLEALYRHALALIVPSVGFETFGIVLIEAFRRGTPALARRLGPFVEIVEACDGGLLFESASQLEVLLRRIVADSAWRRQASARARAGFERLWSEDVVVPRYLEVVADAAGRRGRREVAAIAAEGASACAS